MAGVSMDQVHAQRFGQDNPIPSMQLCIENVDQAGGCDYGYACIYSDTISWGSPTEPLPMIRDPRAIFDRLFGAGGTPEQRAARRASKRSILDWIAEEVSHIQQAFGAGDRRRLDRYLTNIREIERRIQITEERNSSGELRELPAAPAGVPDSFTEHVELMFDLQAMAFAADLDACLLAQAGSRRFGQGVPGEWRPRTVPPDLAPRRCRSERREVRQDQPLPRRYAPLPSR